MSMVPVLVDGEIVLLPRADQISLRAREALKRRDWVAFTTSAREFEFIMDLPVNEAMTVIKDWAAVSARLLEAEAPRIPWWWRLSHWFEQRSTLTSLVFMGFAVGWLVTLIVQGVAQID